MKILFVGPLPPPVTGQAVCFKKIVDHYPDSQKLVINNSKYQSKILSAIYVYLKAVGIVFGKTRDITTIYFTCSRSILGFIKDLPILILSKILKARIINHLHGADFNVFEKKFPFKKFLHWLYQGVESIVLVDEMRNQFVSFSSMKIWTVPNYYDSTFDNYSNNHKKKKGQILFLSNLMKSKGILELIKNADKILSDENKNIVIAGSFMGDKYMSKQQISSILKPEFQRLSLKYGNRFSYRGFVSGDEKIELYASSDVFILPSYTEAFPISIIEAMRMGCLIVTTNADYLSNIISLKNGAIIPLNELEKNMYNYIQKEFQDNISMNTKQEYNKKIARNMYSEASYIDNLTRIIEN